MLIDKIVRAVALYCGGAVLAIMMMVIIVDVTGRYVFNTPLDGSLDLSIVLLVLAVSCAIGYGGRTGAHVTADMVTTVVGPQFEWVSGLCIKTLAAGITAIWSWRLFVTGTTAGRLGESTQLLNIPFEPIYKALSIGVGLYAAVLIVEVFVLARRGQVPLLIDESRADGKPGMTDTAIGLAGIVALFALFILRMPVGLSMLTAGFLGTVAIRGWTHALPSLSSETFAIASFYQLTVIPMFVLMGNIAGASGMGRDLYNAAYAWVGHIRGGLASATIIACAFFASLCGSAAASAVTMGRVALPEMKRFKYDDALATGTVASGGTMGFIFPPSAGLVIYGLLTEQAIGRLFLAGVIPGIILTVLFLITIQIVTWRRPGAGPAGPRACHGRAHGDAQAVDPHPPRHRCDHRRHVCRPVHADRGIRLRRLLHAAGRAACAAS